MGDDWAADVMDQYKRHFPIYFDKKTDTCALHTLKPSRCFHYIWATPPKGTSCVHAGPAKNTPCRHRCSFCQVPLHRECFDRFHFENGFFQGFDI